MAMKCEICGKGPRFGSTISHAHNVSSRRFNPNLQKKRIKVKGQVKTIKICTRCLRTSAAA
ncbi:MAG: 50S ribosomal protein L28 [Candidatus Schekmanbacteria bacterium]|nr:50S ribosomal protein L28 [Candidatus Schekmanbacteria bacterium]